jgi:two-component system, NtrC family, nitrogen regulation response regulator NtrX
MAGTDNQSHHQILVAGPDPAFAQACARMVSSHGYRTETTADLAGLVRVIKNHPCDLLILDYDWDLNGSSKLNLLEEILSEHPFVPVVLLTANAGEREVDNALERGAYDCLDKLGDRQRILLSIRNAIESGRTRRENHAMRCRIIESDPKGSSRDGSA